MIRDKILPMAFLAGLAMTPFAATAQSTTAIGTNQPGTLFYSTGVALAQELENEGISARVQPYAGSGPLMALVNQGALDFAVVNAYETSRAFNGTVPFNTEHDNLRVVAGLFNSQVGFLVNDDSDIEELDDIVGKRIAAGYSSAPIIDLMRQAIMANAGVSDDQVELVSVPNTPRGGDLLNTGRVDVAFLSVGSGSVSELDASLGGVRFLSLYDDEEAIERLQEVMPQGYPAPTDRETLPPGVSEDTNHLTYSVVLVTNKNVSNERVAEILEAMHNRRSELGEAVANFRGLDMDRMSGVPNIQYHEGALEYFNR